ncbi:MAG: hypothetical protein KDA42_14170, partial [Planctomycetales bacterium]|nr:hypothetical protein [Planctomycetales bacterium]
PVGEVTPVSIVVAGPAQIAFGAPVGQTTGGTFPLFDASGNPNPVPSGEDYQIPIELVSLDLVGFDPTGLGEVRVAVSDGLSAAGQLTVGNSGGLLEGDSFFDVTFDIIFVDQGMTIGADSSTNIGASFTTADAISANNAIWLPASAAATGLSQLLLDDAGTLWDTLVSVATRPLRATPIKRYIVQEDLVFGNQPDLPGSIHGLKFDDLNANGVLDAGEPGVADVTIVLSWNDAAGQAQSLSTTTMTNGEFWFENLDPRIQYSVTEQVPSGTVQTTANPPAILLGPAGIEWVATQQQKDALVAGGHNPALVEIEPLLAFGNAYDGSIHGFKFSDLDSDGIWDAGEPGMEGVEIVLTWNDAAGQTQTLSTLSMANGEFWFENLTAGLTYALTEVVPVDTLQSTADPAPIFVESNVEYVATQAQADVLVAAGHPADRIVVDATLVFGNKPDVPGSIHGYKFEDLNVNGIDDNEPRLEGVTITLTGDVDRDGMPDTVVVQTDVNGQYNFENLRPGDYTITETPPAGSINTTPLSFDVTVLSGQELVAEAGQSSVDPENVEDPRVEVVIGPILAFGNAFEGSIHGFKFDDANGNGIWDEGESAVEGVEIHLAWNNAAGQPQSTSTTTMTNGEYWFENLIPGLTYTVTETVPDRWLQRTDNPPPITILSGIEWVATQAQADALVSGGHDPTRIGIEPLLAFGNEFEPTGSIHGLKFEDSNANGQFDPGEPPLEGITIELSWTDELGQTQSQSTTTMSDGQYWFENLPPLIEYTVSEIVPLGSTQLTDAPSLIFLGLDVEWVATQSQADDLIAAGHDPARVEIDPLLAFGNAFDGSIHGLKFEDLDGDRVHDAGEPLLEGVEIVLGWTDSAGQSQSQSTFTMANGEYWFEDLEAGLAYTVTEISPAGMTQSTLNPAPILLASGIEYVANQQQANDLIAAGLDPSRVVIVPLLAFGNYRSVTVTGQKFEDLDGDGVKDAGEPGVSGVTIRLFGTTGAGQNINITTSTGTGGGYSFTGVAPGNYRVAETVPSGWNASTATTVGPFALTSGTTLAGIDFGNFVRGSIHGHKFEDVNINGVDDTEPRLEGVRIVLTGQTGAGANVNRTVFTDASGEYEFLNLNPGTYTVTETPPAGSVATTPVSYNVTVQSREELVAIAGQSNVDAGNPGELRTEVVVGPQLAFGNAFDGSIHGYKFEDIDGDGTWDAGEPPLENVEIVLSWTDSAGQSQTLSTFTMADGQYWFTDLEAALEYTVTEIAPSGSFQTTQNPAPILLFSDFEWVATQAQGDDLITAGLDPSRVMIDPHLAFGNQFGAPGSIHGLKFDDLNVNGLFDLGEPGVEGVEITIAWVDDLGQSQSLSTTTMNDGQYWFENIQSGITYTVRESVPAGSQQTTTDPNPILVAAGVEWVATQAQADALIAAGHDPGLVEINPLLAFGNAYDGSIHGLKFEDLDADGVFDAGEPGLEGVTIVLTWTNTAGQSQSSSTTTMANGEYWFEGLEPGLTYTVREQAPSGTVQTTADPAAILVLSGVEWVATQDQADALAAGGHDPTRIEIDPLLAFGNASNGSIHGLKFEDLDADGQLDPGEPGIAGVTILLTWTDAAGQAQSDSTLTMDNGEFWFENLPAGLTYTVRETAPAGSTQTTEDPAPILLESGVEHVATQQQAIDLTAAGLDPADVVINPLLAFGNAFDGAIHGLKYEDLNANGILDAGEPTIEGVTIALTWQDASGAAQSSSTTTMANGEYWFEDLVAGLTYTAREEAPIGSTQTSANPAPIYLESGIEWVATQAQADTLIAAGLDSARVRIDADLAFGNHFGSVGSIHGLKFDDLNANGVLDAGEPGIEGVAILLTWNDATGTPQLLSTTTMANGEFWFEDIEAGRTYTVREQAPTGSTQTTTDPEPILVAPGVEWVATQDQADALAAAGQDPALIEIDASLAFGNAFDGSIHGLKYEDLNANGAFDAGEPTLEGITILLTWQDASGQNQSLSTTTMAGGEYWFENLAAGLTYTVREQAPAGST